MYFLCEAQSVRPAKLGLVDRRYERRIEYSCETFQLRISVILCFVLPVVVVATIRSSPLGRRLLLGIGIRHERRITNSSSRLVVRQGATDGNNALLN